MLVSFIIPAYNAADAIERCLNSICSLTLKQDEFEVVVIDDCSTDNTCDIVTLYQSMHPNFTLLRQPENHRQGAARNRGVKIAKGEYICFVDSDDAVTDGVVDAIQLAKESDADMVAYHHAFVNEEGMITKEAERLSFADGQIFSGIEMQNRHPYWCAGPVAYIYNRAFLERVNYPFKEDVLYEDSDFVMVHLYRAQRMLYSHVCGYMVYYNANSSTRSTSFKQVADYLLLGTRMLSLYDIAVGEHADVGFADSVLEGACYNVSRTFRRLFLLDDINSLKAFYNRIDATVDRKQLLARHEVRCYYWNAWTYIGLGNREVTMILWSIISPVYRLLKSLKKTIYYHYA